VVDQDNGRADKDLDLRQSVAAERILREADKISGEKDTNEFDTWKQTAEALVRNYLLFVDVFM